MEQDLQLLEVKVIGCFWPYYLWNARHDYLSHLSLSRYLVFTLRAVDWSSLLGSVYYCFLANSIGFVVVAGGFFLLVPGFALGLFLFLYCFLFLIFYSLRGIPQNRTCCLIHTHIIHTTSTANLVHPKSPRRLHKKSQWKSIRLHVVQEKRNMFCEEEGSVFFLYHFCIIY